MCVFYKLSNITYFLVRRLVKTKFISLINIVLNKNTMLGFNGNLSMKDNHAGLMNNEQMKSYKNNLIKNEDLVEKKLLGDSAKINIKDLILNLL